MRVVLFVVLREGLSLDDALRERIRDAIRAARVRGAHRRGCSRRRHRARAAGSITETAVRDVVHGRGVANVEALANPAAAGVHDRTELAS